MIDFLYENFSRSLQLFFLRLGLGKNNYKNFKDLNFKENDFINYKIIKYYVLKNNFINNISVQDVHTFNFLFFYQKLGGKKGIELPPVIKITLNPGDMLYIPRYWMHHVVSETDSMSVNVWTYSKEYDLYEDMLNVMLPYETPWTIGYYQYASRIYFIDMINHVHHFRNQTEDEDIENESEVDQIQRVFNVI